MRDKPLVRLELRRAHLRGLLAALALAVAPAELGSETVTLTTTYPAPFGVYTQIITTGRKAGQPLDTTLNRDGGNTILAAGGGSVGIGVPSPSRTLDVAGGAKFTGSVRVGAPAVADDAATKAYVDQAIANFAAQIGFVPSGGAPPQGQGQGQGGQ